MECLCFFMASNGTCLANKLREVIIDRASRDLIALLQQGDSLVDVQAGHAGTLCRSVFLC